MTCNCCFINYVALYWRSIIAVLTPLALLPVFLTNDSEATRCLYVVLIMIIFWITEALPLPVTSLIPIGLFPLLGVADTAHVCKMYAHDKVLLLLGSLIVGLSIELCNLHKRIALKFMCVGKFSHRRLHFQLMAVSMFLSMWMQNMVVVALMSPICLAILEELEGQGLITIFETKIDKEMILDTDEHQRRLRPTRITSSYFLGISYAASLGGSGFLLGTATNLIFKGIYEHHFPDQEEIDILRFLAYSVPIMLLNTLLTYLWIQFVYMKMFLPKSRDAHDIIVSEESAKIVKDTFRNNYAAMGKITAAEIQVIMLLLFIFCVLLFRNMKFGDHAMGWAEYIYKHRDATPLRIRDATPYVIFIIFLFMLPSKWSCFNFCRTKGETPQERSQSLLIWSLVRRKLPWGLVFLLGAGLAINDIGCKTGLTAKIVEHIDALKKIGRIGVLFIVCLFCQIVTEFTSNVAVASIILPVLAELCKIIKINPIYLMLPAALSISMAFHLPGGTPGNAYVAGLVNISKKSMFCCGFGPSIITLLTYWCSFHTYGTIIYVDTHVFQDNFFNCTISTATS